MTDYSKIEEELTSRGYSESSPEGRAVRKGVLEMLYTLDAQENLDVTTRKMVLDQLISLSRERPLMVSTNINESSTWRQFNLGDGPVGVVLRVKPQTFTSDESRRYNGLVCRLISESGGRAVVKFIGMRDDDIHFLNPKYLEILLLEDKD